MYGSTRIDFLPIHCMFLHFSRQITTLIYCYLCTNTTIKSTTVHQRAGRRQLGAHRNSLYFMHTYRKRSLLLYTRIMRSQSRDNGNGYSNMQQSASPLRGCGIDVLWYQQIKLIQVVSTSEFHEYWWNDVDFFFHPLHLVQGLRSLKH